MADKKLLFISNIAKRVGSFSASSIEAAKQCGFVFYLAANFANADSKQISDNEREYGIFIHNIDLARNPLSLKNFHAYKQLVKLIKEENINYIHCNTPVGGLLGRLAGRKCKVKKIIYQAHGFHVYKGAPKLNWMLYYPIEKWLAHYTDALITINKEDYELAKNKFKLRNGGKVYYVPGVGIDTSLYKTDENIRAEKRTELGLDDDDVAVISMGDLIKRKNYSIAIRAIAEAKNPKLQYFICGNGSEEESLTELATVLGIASQIHFLGFRKDIKELLAASDIFLFTTKQEGLPRSMLEAMAIGLPCIASRVRGNIDLIVNTDGGFLCETNDVVGFAEKLNILANDPKLRKEMGKSNLGTVHNFRTDIVRNEIRQIYDAEKFR